MTHPTRTLLATLLATLTLTGCPASDKGDTGCDSGTDDCTLPGTECPLPPTDHIAANGFSSVEGETIDFAADASLETGSPVVSDAAYLETYQSGVYELVDLNVSADRACSLEVKLSKSDTNSDVAAWLVIDSQSIELTDLDDDLTTVFGTGRFNFRPNGLEVLYGFRLDIVSTDCTNLTFLEVSTGSADCDADENLDQDVTGGADCDDDDSAIYPGAEEIWYDEIDQNCDGASDYDADSDGYDSDHYGGSDCDDHAADTYPGAADSTGDGIDQNCDGTDGIAPE